MSRTRLCAALASTAGAVLLVLGPGPGGPAALAGTAPAELTVELDRSAVTAGPGQVVRVESTVRNTGSRTTSGLVAHLNVLTTDPGVYVDPEDWSPRRTQYLDTLPAGTGARLDWTVQAVTSGPIVVYVAVTDLAGDRVTVSGPLRMTVTGQRVVDAAGVAPLALWVPAGVLALLGAVLARRRLPRSR